MIRVALLWHMHQPVYRHPYSGMAELPWVRLHGIKEYSGMARVLREFPGVSSTVNLVPSLLQQIEAYAAGEHDRFQDVTEKPAVELTARDHAFMARHFFSAHPTHMIQPFPRYFELYNRRRQLAADQGDTVDWRDLQVWSTLAWFDADQAQADDRVRGLRAKGRNFSEQDKAELAEAQLEHLAAVIPAWERLQADGIIEISTSPMTHSILPLLLNPGLGREANPGLPHYDLDFHWPEDARRHLESALDFMQKRFGRRPRGIWPSEGSLSEGVLDLLEELGMAWTASDEINLARSLDPQGRPDWFGRREENLYRPWIAGQRNVRILFRDHDLSDRIGFRYQGMAAEDAVADFMARIRDIARSAGDAVVAVILDGENPWEHYPDNGRPFLRALLGRLQDDPQVETVTFEKAADMDAVRLDRLAPGSWINGNFDIWIGDESDRRAWRQLAAARDRLERTKDGLSAEKVAEARRCLDVAQGSDWFWWFGPEHHTRDLDVFDRLFRLNLQKVYELTAGQIPGELYLPICAGTQSSAVQERPPRRRLMPVLDGEITHFFEWRDAGRLDINAGRGAMDSGESLVTALYYGFDDERFFLRVDTVDRAEAHFRGGGGLRMGVRLSGHPLRRLDIPPAQLWGKGATATVVECGLNLSALGLRRGDRFEFNLEWRLEQRTLQLLPLNGFYAVRVPMPSDYAANWIV